jgi:ABC-type phosphate transport system substrate-binding protein
MKRSLFILGIIFLASICFAKAQIVVIVGKNSSNTASKDEVKKMYSGSLSSWKTGTKAVLIDQPENQAGKEFYSKLLNTTPIQIRATLLKLVLSGQIPAPIKTNSDSEVKKLVSNNPNAIGYINASSVDESVTVLFKLE